MTEGVRFTQDEFDIACTILAGLNPDNYKHLAAKALILKAKAGLEKLEWKN